MELFSVSFHFKISEGCWFCSDHLKNEDEICFRIKLSFSLICFCCEKKFNVFVFNLLSSELGEQACLQ